eukprot:4285642-Prymnesium_polylepis.2
MNLRRNKSDSSEWTLPSVGSYAPPLPTSEHSASECATLALPDGGVQWHPPNVARAAPPMSFWTTLRGHVNSRNPILHACAGETTASP